MFTFYKLVLKSLQSSILNPEIARYVVAGIATNTIGYLIYLMLTLFVGVGPKTAMTVLYAIGTIINFYVHRRWTFRVVGAIRYSMIRNSLAILLGYLLNLILLFILVDLASFPHELVQASAIVAISIYFFLINKYFVHVT